MQVKTIKKKAALQLLLLFSILVKTKWYWQVVSNFKGTKKWNNIKS